jgi:hypothetical protein
MSVMNARRLSLVTLTALFASVSAGNATTVFVDSFQTDLSQWVPAQGYTGTAAIVADPLGGGGNALTFGQATGHGDIVTANTFGTGGTYTVSFDYLGLCGYSNCGLTVYDPSHDLSLVMDFAYPNLLLQVASKPVWQHASVTFNASGPMSLLLEDWNGDYPGQTYGGHDVVYLRNMEVSQTPLPAALPLYATGLGALGLLRWFRKRRPAAT